MKGYIGDIEKETVENNDFRRVLYTSKHSQLVVMSLKPGEEIGAEVHDELDQFIRIEEGKAQAILDGKESYLKEDEAIVVPASMDHNVINTGEEDLKLYTIYSPPEHRDGVVHRTKEEAEADDEHFDGETTEP